MDPFVQVFCGELEKTVENYTSIVFIKLLLYLFLVFLFSINIPPAAQRPLRSKVGKLIYFQTFFIIVYYPEQPWKVTVEAKPNQLSIIYRSDFS